MELHDVKIVTGYDHLECIRQLIIQYTRSLNRNLDFQNLKEELQDIEKKYGRPAGALLAALSEEYQVIGCVALRPLGEGICEMKRLYVLPEYRSKKIGLLLVQRIIEEARLAGYREMRLDTLEPMKPAIALYKKCGFREIPAYYPNPMSDVIYMALSL